MYSLLLLFAPSVEALGSPDWPTREAAQAELRSWGCLAWPMLERGAANDSPEVRFRVRELLAPQRAFLDEWRAYGVLVGRISPDPFVFWWDYELRLKVFRMAKAAGCTHVAAIDPDSDWQWDECEQAVWDCRLQLRGDVTVPMVTPAK